jgi:hypothetical protein
MSGIRALKADYNYSSLRNLQGNNQNRLRPAAGIVFRAGEDDLRMVEAERRDLFL